MRRLKPTETDRVRRVRCCAHILNLAAKAFLLGDDCEAFEAAVDLAEQATVRDETNLAAEQAKWRTKGPIGKFHNIVAFIRALPQRREEFRAAVQMTIDQAVARGKRTLPYLNFTN
jgi:hypothetical protein